MSFSLIRARRSRRHRRKSVAAKRRQAEREVAFRRSFTKSAEREALVKSAAEQQPGPIRAAVQRVLGLLRPDPVQPTRRSSESSRATQAPMQEPRCGRAYQLKLTVVDAPRPVWRRVRVFGDVSMYTLNQYIRRAFGWEIERDYRLRVRRPWTAEPKANRERRVSLCELVSEGDALSFFYQDGNGWEVHALVEATEAGFRSLGPTCIGGGGATLPAKADRPWLPPQVREIARERRPVIRSEAGEPIDIDAVTACMRQPAKPRAAEPSAVAAMPAATEPVTVAAAEPAAIDAEICSVCHQCTPKVRRTACCGLVVCYGKMCGRHEHHVVLRRPTNSPAR